jgi:hypothetical protein
LKELLTERLTQFEKVNLTITGFTDPIGGACYNRRLGNDRADAIIEIVRQISPAAQINRLEPVVREEQMSESDKALADKCKAKFHFGKPELEQPLRFFTVDERKKKVNGCMREPNDLTPNFIWGRCVPGENTEAQEDQCLIHYDPKKNKEFKNASPTLVAMKRAAHFYELLRCLAPLRRVEIKGDASPVGGQGGGAGK